MTDVSISFVKSCDTLNYILDFIVNKKAGMYLRFGDGDFNLAENKHDMLAEANYELQLLMLKSMSIRDERIMICVPHHSKELNTLEIGMYPGNHEYDIDSIKRFLSILQSKCNNLPPVIYTNVALSYCSVYYPDMVIQLHKELKNNKIVYIGNHLYSDLFLNKLFGETITRINTNHNNAFHNIDHVFTQLEELMNNPIYKTDYFIIIIASGCASRAFASLIYDKYFTKNENFFLFDYGSLLDYFYGFNTRAYMDLMPPKKDYILENI